MTFVCLPQDFQHFFLKLIMLLKACKYFNFYLKDIKKELAEQALFTI